MKILEKNTEHFKCKQRFLNKTQKVLTIKILNNKMDCNQIKNICPRTEWEVTWRVRKDICNTYIQKRTIEIKTIEKQMNS